MQNSSNLNLVKAKNKTWLYDYTVWDDYYGYPWRIVEPGEQLYVLTERFSDGRTYYTGFIVSDDVIYATIVMRDADGSLHQQCGFVYPDKLRKLLSDKVNSEELNHAVV